MFWALAQWQKDKDAAVKARREMRARAWAKGYAEGWEIGFAEGQKIGYRQVVVTMWNASQSEEERNLIRRVAAKRGIILPASGVLKI